MPKKKTQEQWEKEVKKLYPNREYSFMETYKGSEHKILCKCNSCSKEWETIPYNFLNGNGCPQCSQSHLEKYTSKYLDKHNINYIAQHRFSKCKDRLSLPFDFYLPKLGILIECQGKQHYEYVPYFGSVTRFARYQLHDRIKRNYAKNNGLLEIEIPYTENSYEKLSTYLDNELLVFGGNL